MKVELLKDVLTPENGVGRIGQVVELNATVAKHFLDKGLGREAAEGAEALPPDPKPAAAKVLTHDTLKENAEAKKRDKKPAPGPEETK